MQSKLKIGQVYIFGITGGTGCGKSHVASLFADLGAYVIDVDKVGHAVLDGNAHEDVIAQFGEGILQDGKKKIDRKKLGKLVFSSPPLLKLLNNIVHPHITAQVYRLVADSIWRYKVRAVNFGVQKPHIIVIDAALLHELNLHNICDYTILVQASMATRRRRIIKRDNITNAHATARIESQSSLAFAKASLKVSVVVQND